MLDRVYSVGRLFHSGSRADLYTSPITAIVRSTIPTILLCAILHPTKAMDSTHEPPLCTTLLCRSPAALGVPTFDPKTEGARHAANRLPRLAVGIMYHRS